MCGKTTVFKTIWYRKQTKTNQNHIKLCDFSDYQIRKLAVCLAVFSVLMLIFTVIGLLSSVQGVTDGKSLILPFQENSKKAVAEIIDREVQEGRVLVDEYLENFSDKKEAHGERIMLTPSYLLFFNSMGKITAIPREKIYRICAQAGIRGARLL